MIVIIRHCPFSDTIFVEQLFKDMKHMFVQEAENPYPFQW